MGYVVHYFITKIKTKIDVIPRSRFKVVSCKRKGGGPAAVVKAACLESRRLRVRTPLWPPSYKETKCFVKIQYCGEPPWPRGSVIGLRLPGLEFRSVCLEGSVISLSSGGSLLAQFSLYVHKGGLKPHSFHFISCKRNSQLEVSGNYSDYAE